ncbi:YopN family type III secretion system gatekeeper subunit [Erwinia psidii]|uniref:type III secretion system gatekeeper subunit SctW n=1 Tax=Erwinia psidii TaxID=69224 RepID=UPI00226B0AC7|nr:type III secretion system gatekeeper subunit SctW [Erwinia psidii]MCX8966676.1 YopN family type III secretion system gatekeeper subunit [Erwinia psidii]
MNIRPTGLVDVTRVNYRLAKVNTTNNSTVEAAENLPVVNVQEEIYNASEELASLLSVFGRFTRANRKNAPEENDFFASVLEEQAEEKMDTLIKYVARPGTQNNILNFARGLFPNDSDLMMALLEMLLSRKLSELKKKKIKEAISDLEKFADQKKMQSGINVSRVARRFSTRDNRNSLSAKDLRRSYLRFLELELPAGFIYQDWIDEFGYRNRKRLLSFTLSALITDIKANEPGIQFDEFGPLSAKLSDARVLNTLDQSLNKSFSDFIFFEQLRNETKVITEDDIVGVYMKGILKFPKFKSHLKTFMDEFMSSLLIRQRAEVIQSFYNIYNMTPDFIFSDKVFKDKILEMILLLSTDLHKKEKTTGIWSEYYI